MKDSQRGFAGLITSDKYIKANNERFSTREMMGVIGCISISRRIMKDSQPFGAVAPCMCKYIKANNERFSTSLRTARNGN